MIKENSTELDAVWSKYAYSSWESRFGTSKEYSSKIKENPLKELPFADLFEELSGKKVLQILGLHGNKAVALSLLGADVTILDYSTENQKYALELGKYADVNIKFVVGDVTKELANLKVEYFDYVFINGKLQYLVMFKEILDAIKNCLKKEGKLIIRDYHPIRKMLTWTNGIESFCGNYFDSTIQSGKVPQWKFVQETDRQNLFDVPVRYYTLSEIFNYLSENKFIIERFDETKGPKNRYIYHNNAPSDIDEKIPGIFMLVAKKS